MKRASQFKGVIRLAPETLGIASEQFRSTIIDILGKVDSARCDVSLEHP